METTPKLLLTFFHEFGHLNHHIVAGKQRWAGVSGISAELDFNEVPLQMLEEWMAYPDVLASFAKHCKDGGTYSNGPGEADEPSVRVR